MTDAIALEKNMLNRVSMGDTLVRSAARYPNRSVLRFKDINYTFKQLNDAVNRCAYSLSKLGLRKGDKAAVLSHNSDQFIIYWWASMKLGIIFTPVNWMLKGEEIKFIIDHSESKIFFIEDALIPNIESIKENLKTVQHFGYFNLTGAEVPEGWINFKNLYSTDFPTSEPTVEIYDADIATLLYTSGTESAPKGVMNTHLNFVCTIASAQYDILLRKDDVMLLGIPLYHVAGMWMFFACCSLGALTLLEYIPDPQEILQITDEEKVTRWCWPTTVYINLPKLPNFSQYDLSSIRVAQLFGAPAPPSLLENWRKISPGIIFMNCYGQTEMTPLGATISGKEIDNRPDSVGLAMLPVEIKIFGPDDRELPHGEVGEIVARGPNMMHGYYKEPEKTAHAQRGGWHHTGDLGKKDEKGYLYFVDRIKDMIKTGGENVASADVEASLFKHPKILDVAVIGLPDEIWSEAITAVIVLSPDQEVEEKEIIAWCKENMAPYKIPKKVIFIDELPRNPSGKVLKKDLRLEYSR